MSAKKKTLTLLPLLFLHALISYSQIKVDLKDFHSSNGVTARVKGARLTVTWPAGKSGSASMAFNLEKKEPLFDFICLNRDSFCAVIASEFDPAFILTVGKRTLDPSSGGWDVFFDKVPTRPYQSYVVAFNKTNAKVISKGTQTIVRFGEVTAPGFKGVIEVTAYNGSPLFNVAAVMTTEKDSTAILYDAGLVSRKSYWESIGWYDTAGTYQRELVSHSRDYDTAKNMEVKYRAIVADRLGYSLAVFPAPHQYFYPLDEAFNLKFTWYGGNYRGLLPGVGIGIRQDPLGDRRYVPWFNAPPGTAQRLNFFCLMSASGSKAALDSVKKFTHGDRYPELDGYKTFQSHFHNEFISSVVTAGKPIPKEPEFVDVFKKTGVNIVHLAEFHGPGHPKGPDSTRLKELQALFQQCERLSGKNFLLLPGEEANNFYGGHWLSLFPKPVYWVMSHKPETPFVAQDAVYGKVYHVGNKEEMLKLNELENGLSWTAHARTKASTGYPDAYKNEPFYLSKTFMGAAWKAIPADLSLQTLSKRVLNLMDDMSNWGLKKHVIGECDIFSITHENEMYAHLNVNYLRLPQLPDFKNGWQAVLDTINKGAFFVTTGEILLPEFSVDGKRSGETLTVKPDGKATLRFVADWTFPLNYAEVISGDGKQVYRDLMDLSNSLPFGNKEFRIDVNLKGRKWVRLEVWDVAADGAFTQQVWLE